MITDNNTGLVLEGGGLRGVFKCGVLDCFMDQDLIERLEETGNIIVLRPERPIEVSRMAMTLPEK